MPKDDLVFNTREWTITDGRLVMFLGRSRFVLLKTLVENPQGLTMWQLAAQVYADRPDGGPDDPGDTIHTQICHMRRKLKPFGISIKSTHGPGAVYHVHVPRQN